MKLRILIVDDDVKIGRLLERKLSRQEYDALYVSSAREALAAIHRDKPDAIVSDVEMPDMDGHALCAQVRGDPDARDIPFVFLSARTETTDELKGLALGADAYVCKPLDIETLIEQLEKVVVRSARFRSRRLRQARAAVLAELNPSETAVPK